MNAETEKAIDKIRKLLKLSEGTDNQEESASAAAMAAQIMERHNILMADVATKDSPREKMAQEDAGVPSKVVNKWKSTLIVRVADAFGCAAKWQWVDIYGDRMLRIRFYGRESDVKACILAYEFCERETERLTLRNTKGLGRTFANNYRHGCVDAIEASIQAEKAALHEELREEVSSSALVIVETRVVEAKKAFGIKYTRAAHRHTHDRSARNQGRHDGQNIWTGTKKRLKNS